MILTEEEAKTKRCQESFGPPLSPDGNAAVASQHSVFSAVQTSPMFCVGSACMAWRWKIEGGQMMVAPAPAGFNQAHAVPVPGTGQPSTTHGYCGKAGRP